MVDDAQGLLRRRGNVHHDVVPARFGATHFRATHASPAPQPRPAWQQRAEQQQRES